MKSPSTLKFMLDCKKSRFRVFTEMNDGETPVNAQGELASNPPASKPISPRKRDKALNLDALETLVITFGPREAARQAGMNANTVLSLAKRKGWHQVQSIPHKPGRKPQTLITTSQSQNGSPRVQEHFPPKTTPLPLCNQSAPKALASVLTRLKERSTHNLALYSAKASEAALKSSTPLEISRKVKDVADIHKTIWPQENEQKNILQIGFIITGK